MGSERVAIVPRLRARGRTFLDRLDSDAAEPLPASHVSPRVRVAIVLAVAALSLIAMRYAILPGQAQDGMVRAVRPLLGLDDTEFKRHAELLRAVAWSLGAVVFYLAIPLLVVRFAFGHRASHYGFTLRGFRRHLALYLGLLAPVVVIVAAGSSDFQAKYPLSRHPIGAPDLIAWELCYGLQFVALEFFFRGFLIHGVRDRLGTASVFTMVVPYVMIHFEKPLYETLGALVAGTVLGFLSLRTRSIAGGVLIHFAVALTMDLAALARQS